MDRASLVGGWCSNGMGTCLAVQATQDGHEGLHTVSTRLQPSPGAGSRRWRLVNHGFGIVGIQLGCIIVRYRVCSCERGSRLLWEGECARDGLPLSRVVSRVSDASVAGGNSYSSLLAKPSGSLLGQWWQRARRRRARARRQLRWSVVGRHDG